VTAQHGGRASVCSRGAEAQWQWEPHEGHVSWVLSVHRRRGGELDRGHLGVHVAQQGAPMHRAYLAMDAHTGSTTQGLDGTLLASLASVQKFGRTTKIGHHRSRRFLKKLENSTETHRR
jgi:hypothetical protein